MIYGSVCSGVEAASVAWAPLGWRASFFSEIAHFPRAVLKHHYPNVPLHDDFTTIQNGDYESINLLVGGTPCQSFSIAGLRAGMDDPRGNLTLEYCKLVGRLNPEWIVWENVPGVLSADKGEAFRCFISALAELGYGLAWRILDAQFFGVPQRRRRVFVIGYLGDGQPAAEVLFDGEGMCGHNHARRTKESHVAALTATGVGASGADDNQAQAGHFVTHTLRGEGFDASEDGTGRGTPIIPTFYGIGPSGALEIDVSPTLDTRAAHGPIRNQLAPAIAYQCHGTNVGEMGTLKAGNGHLGGGVPFLNQKGVRRLTPCECERLQGFPDNYTLVPYRKKVAADGPRYKATGNSMAVPCMAWLGQRIAKVDAKYRRAA